MSESNANSRDRSQVIERAGAAVFSVLRGRVPASATLWGEGRFALTVAHAMGESREGQLLGADGRTVDVELVARDPGSDLAVLRVADPSEAGLSAAESSPRLGQSVIGLGRSERDGLIAHAGIVARDGPAWRSRLGGRFERRLGIDARVPREAHGGPLLDEHAGVLAIATAGIGQGTVHVPAADAGRILEELLESGDRRPGYLGVRFSAATLDDHPSRRSALMITGVVPRSPAAHVGIHSGDAIVGFDDELIEGGDDLWAALASSAGRTVRLELWRGGESRTVEVVPDSRGSRGARRRRH